MKRMNKMVIALVAILTLTISFSACGKTDRGNSEVDNATLQGIFEKLQANPEYQSFKTIYPDTTIEERLEGNKITFSSSGGEYIKGDYTFELKDGYFTTTSEQGDYIPYTFMMYLKDAVAHYYGMNNSLMSGYLAGLDNFGKENKYFLTEEQDGKLVYKLYAAGAWDMQGLEEMYINDKAVDYLDPLTDHDVMSISNCGKISAISYGNKDHYQLMIGEYDGNTELTYKSIISLINKYQPTGYEEFLKDFTELKETSGNGYTVAKGISQDIKNNFGLQENEGYEYMFIEFK